MAGMGWIADRLVSSKILGAEIGANFNLRAGPTPKALV